MMRSRGWSSTGTASERKYGSGVEALHFDLVLRVAVGVKLPQHIESISFSFKCVSMSRFHFSPSRASFRTSRFRFSSSRASFSPSRASFSTSRVR